MIRIRSQGRGTHYGVVRGVSESVLRLAYKGDWPARLWEALPGSCDVDCVRHTIPLLPPGHSALRLGFVSDLHVGPTTPVRLVETAFEHLARAELDVLLLGGDYVFLDANADRLRTLARAIERVPAKRKLAVLGNHDLWTHHALIEEAFRAAGVEFLTNRSVPLAHPGVRLVGLDEPWTGTLDSERAFAAARDHPALVVLCHSPDGLPYAQRAIGAMAVAPRVLYLCGHTHGGQISTPWGPIIVPGRVGRLYPAGLHRVGGIDLYVSRGVGGVELPIRAYANPEVAVFELTSFSVDDA